MDLMTYLSEMEKLFNKQEIIDEIIKNQIHDHLADHITEIQIVNREAKNSW